MNKKSAFYTPALFLAVLSVFSFGVLSAPDAYAAKHRAHHHAAKKTVKKKSSTKKTAPKPARAVAKGKPIMGIADPNSSEPSEMITAIKNRAQDAFWQGKRPYPVQLKEQANPAMAKASADALQKNEALQRASYSELSGITFDDQPISMNASEAFRRSLDTVSFELGRPCKEQEYFGWPLQQTEQGRVDRIFEETNEKFKLRGFSVTPRRPRSVGSDVSVFTADRLNKKILGIWSAGDAGLLLLMCDTEAPQEITKAKQETSATKKKAAPVRKKTRKLFSTNKASQPVSEKSKTAPAAADANIPVPEEFKKEEFKKPEPSSAAPVVPVSPSPEPVVATPPVPPANDGSAPIAKPQVIPGAPPKDIAPVAPVAPKPAGENPPAAFVPAATPPVTPVMPKVDAAPKIEGPKIEGPSAADAMKALPPEVTPAAPTAESLLKQGAASVQDVAVEKAKEAVKEKVMEAVPVPSVPKVPSVTDIVKP